ncbi:hypothetical protein [Methanomicrobium sp. W14]|uniref:hypothetical protein n=1 Tax=Methanomicrobium sp. W14 TaxID=2817839 RepID=UPI0032B01B4F
MVLALFLIIIAVLVSGCTSAEDSKPATETQAIQSTEEVSSANDTESSSLKVPWPQEPWPPLDENPVPPSYSGEKMDSAVKEAKQEIMRLFPDIDESTLDNVSWGYNGYNSYQMPVLVFSNVMEPYGGKDTAVEIRYDPERKIVCSYTLQNGVFCQDSDKTIISRDEAKEHALEFYKKANANEYEYHKDDFVTVFNDENDPQLYDADITTKYKGIIYSFDNSGVGYDLRYDRVWNYYNGQGSHDIMSQITTLSPTPDITIDEAKEILEKYLKDKNDGEEVSIEYCPRYEYDSFPNLMWDDNTVMDNCLEDGYIVRPFKLVWELPYTTSNGRMHYGIIDAHTGDVLYVL